MRISSSETVGSAYTSDAASGKAAAASTPMVATDTVTLTNAARKLAQETTQLNAAIAELPAPVAQLRAQDAKKKRLVSALPMLDVDAMRLIRDKLRAQNLGVKDLTPKEKDLKTDKAEANSIQR